MAALSLCLIPDCRKPVCNIRGWCCAHYARWRKHGDPLGGGTTPGEPLRFYQEVVVPYDGNDCLIWPYGKDGKGYGRLHHEGRQHIVSRLICEEANGPPPTPKHEAAHSCGNGHLGCCAKSHLRWDTAAGNLADELIHGTRTRGERHFRAKLTADDVREIRRLWAGGAVLQREMAVKFNIRESSVTNIIARRSWAWLE